MRKRGSDPLRVQQWTSRLAGFTTSRLTVARFCQGEGVSSPSFYQWRRKLAERRDTGRRPVAKSKRQAVAASRETPDQRGDGGSFQTVQLIQGSELEAGVTLRLSGGVQLALGDNLPAIEMVVDKLLCGVSHEAGGPTC